MRACSPRKVLEIRCSEITSEAILGQKQSRSSSVRYMACGVLYPIFGCPCMYLLSHQISMREGTMVDRTTGGVKDGEIVCREY